MKRILIFVTLLVVLSGCQDKLQETQSSAYSDIIKLIHDKFNSEEEIVTINYVEDVSDNYISDTHGLIQVDVLDNDYRLQLINAQKRISANQGTKSDYEFINDIQFFIESSAKQLTSVDALSFSYPDEVGQNVILAYSTNDKNFIPIMLPVTIQAIEEVSQEEVAESTTAVAEWISDSATIVRTQKNPSSTAGTTLSSNETSNIQSQSQPQNNQGVINVEIQLNEIDYWSALAAQYGMEVYNPYGGSEEEYINYVYSEVVDNMMYEAYWEGDDGYIYENPIYDGRNGPE